MAKPKKIEKTGTKWLNPVGGIGDCLMLSGVLKQTHEKFPDWQYMLIRRTKYPAIFSGHPAIEGIGYPPVGAEIINTGYWSLEELGEGSHRPYQILARAFGLKTPIEEKLFLPNVPKNDPLIDEIISGRDKVVVIAPLSDSPRKVSHPMSWHFLVERLTAEGAFVMQVGKINEMHIKGAYSLLGVTTPHQLVHLVSKSKLVITSDNFIMHSAHLANVPAVALWGPTCAKVYGYEEHVHFQASIDHCHLKDQCLGPELGENYPTPCPLKEEHCMNKIAIEEVFMAAMKFI